MIETERKFLVDKRRLHELTFESEEVIVQGYLSTNPTVRIRLRDNRGFLTIKGPTRGLSRHEYEYEIPTDDAAELLKLCGGKVLKKIRRTLTHAEHVWEVDFFMGRHAGLVMAEVELTSPDEQFILPDWITREVSADARYANSFLASSDKPYRKKE